MGDSGKLSVQLGDKLYNGEWIYLRDGSVGFGTAFSGTASATGVGYGFSMSGPGKALMSAEDGSRLRCVFQFSEWSGKGIGECINDATKETYDLMIK